MYIYICIYIYLYTHTHTHTHIYITRIESSLMETEVTPEAGGGSEWRNTRGGLLNGSIPGGAC